MALYHLPADSEFTRKQGLIASQHNKILSIETRIEQEIQNLDNAISALNEQHRPSFEAIKARIKALLEQEEKELDVLEYKRRLSEDDLRLASKKKVAALEAERAVLDKELKNEKAVIAPIRWLPSEVLREIFEWAELVDSPWELTKVCKTWRSIALRTPQLWTKIYVTSDTRRFRPFSGSNSSKLPPTSSFCVSPPRSEWDTITYNTDFGVTRKTSNQKCKSLIGLEKAVGLCGNVPLTIILDLRHFNKANSYHLGEAELKEKNERGREMLEFLIPYLPRCRAITIEGMLPISYLGDQISARLQNLNLKVLEQLKIYTKPNTTIHSLLLVAQQTALRLWKIVLSYGDLSNDVSPILQTSRLKHLTSLEVHTCQGLRIGENEAAWAALTSLKDLEMSGRDFTTWPVASLPSLERLAVINRSITDLGGALITLKFLYLENVPTPPSNFIISVPFLETLILVGKDMEIAKCVEAPELDSLHLYHAGTRQKTLCNSMVSSIWNTKGERSDKLLNPRHLYLVIDAGDEVMAKALKAIDRVETLVIGLREQKHAGRKLLEALTVVPQVSKTKSGKENRLGLCPKLRAFEVFTMTSDGSPGQWSYFEQRTRLQNHMIALQKARPTVACTLTQNDQVQIPSQYVAPTIHMK